MRVELNFPPMLTGEPTIAGLIYTPEVIDLILNQIRGRLPWHGCLDHPADGRMRIAEISHSTLSVDKRGLDIVAEVELLNTPKGLLAQKLFEAQCPMVLAPLMIGSQDPDGTLHNNVRVASLNIIVPGNGLRSPLDLIVRSIFNPQ